MDNINISANIKEKERAVSVIAGSLLMYYMLKKHKTDALLTVAGGFLIYRGLSGHCPLRSLKDRSFASTGENINVRTHVLVNRPREEVYAFWRKLENLNLFMEHVEHIREIGDRLSTWKIKIPGGLGSLEWEAEIVKEEEGSEISWHSKPGSSIENAGKINFTDTAAKGTTRIDALISYRAPFGRIGEGISRLLTPLFKHKIEEDIRRFKYYMESAGK
ncbi:MAG TPA: SRPBCC family protein [Puia sp.]